MKTLIITLCVIVVILLSAIFIGSTELKNLVRLKQSELEGLKKANKIERDSLQNLLEVTKDSLQIAFETIKTARKESIEARERTQATIRNLQKIIYIKYESDSARTNAIKELYPTFKP